MIWHDVHHSIFRPGPERVYYHLESEKLRLMFSYTFNPWISEMQWQLVMPVAF